MNHDIFKAYDIRGIFPTQINEKIAESIGRAFGAYVGKGKSILAGFDARTSSPRLYKSMVAGIRESGVNVVEAGFVPTPVIYFGVLKYNLDGGIIVTASHNPKEWNGFKMYGENGVAIGYGSGLEIIENLCNEDRVSSSVGKIKNIHEDLLKEYKKDLLGKAELRKGISIAVDPGNGSFSRLAKEVLEGFGATVKTINDIPDGRFPSRSPEPKNSTISKLKSFVKKEKVDFGVAFDSDGDRAVFVDEKGNTLSCDATLSLIFDYYVKKGDKAVYEVSCSKAVNDVIKKSGGIPIMTRTGRTFILNEMKKENAKIGGENSGHIYFSDLNMDDDALFGAIKMAEILSKKNKPLSELADGMPRYFTIEKQFEVDENFKFKTIDLLKRELSSSEKAITIDGVKVLRKNGWFLIRASNTSPLIRMIAESDSKKNADALALEAEKIFYRVYREAASDKNSIKNILVTGAGGPAGICVIKSLKDKYRIIATDIDNLAPGLYLASKGYIVPKASDKGFISSILKLSKKEKISVIIPTVEEELIKFSENLQLFEKEGIAVVVSNINSLNASVDKSKTYTLFEKEKYCPRLYSQSTVKFPVVVKPTASRGGRGIFICEDSDELKVALKKNGKNFNESLIMEYVDGIEYSVYGLSDKNGFPLLTVPIKRIHAVSESKKAQTVDDKEVINTAKDIAIKLKLVGPWNVQLMRGKQGLKLIEVNPRFAGTTSLVVASGVNLPELSIKVFSGETINSKMLNFQKDIYMTRYNEEAFLIRKEGNYICQQYKQ